MLHMLDTDTCSSILRGRSLSAESKLVALMPDDVCISVITRAELMYGLKGLPQMSKLHVGLPRFIRRVHVLSWDDDAADYYAEIRHQLVSSGQPIGGLDMMIAAHSLAAGAVLVTNNVRHYSRIAQPLTIANWKV